MTEAVYTTYTNDTLPQHPGEGWTRFVCISDTHSRVFPVPEGDILLHAGDLSSWGSLEQLKVTLDWLESLPHEWKIIVAGNHDLCLDVAYKNKQTSRLRGPEEIDAARALLLSPELQRKGITYLENQLVEARIHNGLSWRIYGSPATPRFVRGAFQYTTNEEGAGIWARIPVDAEIVITHTPARNVLDKTRLWTHAGCKALSKRLESINNCRMHVFGHIHESHGALVSPGPNGKQLVSVNAALYERGQAIVVDLHKPSP